MGINQNESDHELSTSMEGVKNSFILDSSDSEYAPASNHKSPVMDSTFEDEESVDESATPGLAKKKSNYSASYTTEPLSETEADESEAKEEGDFEQVDLETKSEEEEEEEKEEEGPEEKEQVKATTLTSEEEADPLVEETVAVVTEEELVKEQVPGIAEKEELEEQMMPETHSQLELGVFEQVPKQETNIFEGIEEAWNWTGALWNDLVQDIINPIPPVQERDHSVRVLESMAGCGGEAFAMRMDGGNLATCLEKFRSDELPSTFHLELPRRLSAGISGRMGQLSKILPTNSSVTTVSVVVPVFDDETESQKSEFIKLFEAVGSLSALEELSIGSNKEGVRSAISTKAVTAALKPIAKRSGVIDPCPPFSLSIKNILLTDSGDDMADFQEAVNTISCMPSLKSAVVEVKFN